MPLYAAIRFSKVRKKLYVIPPQSVGRNAKAPRPAPNGRAYRLWRKIFSTSSVVSLW